MDILGHPYFKTSPKLSYRFAAFAGYRRGEFTFFQFLNLLLPSSLKDQALAKKLQDFFNRYQEETSRDFINPDGSFSLYGHPFYASSHGEALVLIEQVIVQDQYQARRWLKEGDTVIDAGANIGTFSVKAAHDFPSVKIYAIEPATETFGLLEKNTAPYQSVTCVHAGLGDREGKKELAKYHGQLGTARIEGSVLAPHDERYGAIEKETVSLTTIDALVRKQNIPRVDFIKMDTEGYEEKILRGAAETIKKWKPVIVMSAYHAPTDKTELPKLLKSICPEYVCELHRDAEEDLVCYASGRAVVPASDLTRGPRPAAGLAKQ